MKTANELTREQLEDIVRQIQSILWLDNRTGSFDPDLSWNTETIEWVSGVLEDAGLKPGAAILNDGVSPDPEGHTAQTAGDVPSGNQQTAADGAGANPAADTVRKALDDFIETIEATGGCFHNEGGVLVLAGDPEWTDLADAYVRACAAIGRAPLVTAIEGGEEIEAV